MVCVTSCFIRISKILLYAIHNSRPPCYCYQALFYQDFKDTFVCNTQPIIFRTYSNQRCFIRISKILLYAIHNEVQIGRHIVKVVLSGFQRYFCMQYTTNAQTHNSTSELFYQDFKDTFVCNTQPDIRGTHSSACCFIRMSMNNSAAKVQKK